MASSAVEVEQNRHHMRKLNWEQVEVDLPTAQSLPIVSSQFHPYSDQQINIVITLVKTLFHLNMLLRPAISRAVMQWRQSAIKCKAISTG